MAGIDIKQFISHNLIACFLVTFATFFSSILVAQMDSAIGSYFWFPLGAIIFSYLLFDTKVLLGTWVGSVVSGVLFLSAWKGLGGIQFGLIESLLGSLAPLIAIAIMKGFNLSDFFNAEKIDFFHVSFLVILSALLNSLFKFFLMFNYAESQPDPIDFMSTYLVGDMIGGMVFIYIGTKVFPLFFPKNKSI